MHYIAAFIFVFLLVFSSFGLCGGYIILLPMYLRIPGMVLLTTILFATVILYHRSKK